MRKYKKLLDPLTYLFASSTPQHWADLGCGTGVFTEALAGYLPENSLITAIDLTHQQLDDRMGNNVSVDFCQANFVSEDLPTSNLDGILFANALHFVKDKEALIRKLEKQFKSTPTFLIVEYDHTQPNQWEPYPLPFAELDKMFNKLGYKKIERTGEKKSVYGGMMYACLISKN